jgi:hypothetical protein
MANLTFDTLDDLLESLGGISPRRVLLKPTPGTATVRDVIRHIDADKKRLVELIDGTLVEKPMGFAESMVAATLEHFQSVPWGGGVGVRPTGRGPHRAP